MRKPFSSLIKEISLVLALREGPKISEDKNPHSLISVERVFKYLKEWHFLGKVPEMQKIDLLCAEVVVREFSVTSTVHGTWCFTAHHGACEEANVKFYQSALTFWEVVIADSSVSRCQALGFFRFFLLLLASWTCQKLALEFRLILSQQSRNHQDCWGPKKPQRCADWNLLVTGKLHWISI